MRQRIRRFLDECHRRHVGRVAVAYLVSAWVLIQVADVVVPRLNFPDTLVTLLIVLAIMGFPVALVLSWFYALVPERLDVAPRSRWLAATGVALVALLALAGATTLWPRIAAPERVRSIAVLPFDDLSDDPEQEYLAAGMQDALITQLAQIGAIRVISRTSTLRYRETERPLPEIARELGVDALVEASVLRVGDQLRIQAQLIRPLPREQHLWAEEFERDMRSVLTVHAEIARGIARAVRAPLTRDEAGRLAAARVVDPRAYESYLRGMFFLSQQTPEGYERGLRHLHEAVQFDPADPAAYAGLALGYSLAGHGLYPDHYRRAKAAAARALSLDSTNTMAHEALAEIALYYDFDLPAAGRALRNVLAVEPNFADANAHYSWYLLTVGQYAEAVQAMTRACRLDPLNALWAGWLAWIQLDTDNEAALRAALDALELSPDHPHALYPAARAAAELGRREEALRLAEPLAKMPAYRWALGHVHAVLGDTADARAIARELDAQPGAMNTWGAALILAELGEAGAAMDRLEEARRLHFSWIPWSHHPSVFVPLPTEPRFIALLERLGVSLPRRQERATADS